MSKGYTRRPAFIDRKAYAASWQRIFAKNQSQSSDPTASTDGVVAGENGDVARAEDEAHSEAKSRELTVRACRFAEVMEQGFGDQRSHA